MISTDLRLNNLGYNITQYHESKIKTMTTIAIDTLKLELNPTFSNDIEELLKEKQKK